MFQGDGGGIKAGGGAKNAAQILQMQRFLATGGGGQRPAGGRSNFFGDGANFGDMEFARQLQQQRQSAAAAVAAAQRHAAPWANASRDDFGAAVASSNAGYGSSAGSSGYGNGSDFGSQRGYVFKCPDCSFNKNSCEDLEIHIKTEHLNWLPFQCPFCQQSRASDSQMREHIHSVHKKPENKYFYVDNPMAKRMLQEMIDRALFNASRSATAAATARNGGYGNANGGPPFLNPFNSNGGYFTNGGDYGGDGDASPPARKQPRLTSQAQQPTHPRRVSPAPSSDRHSNHSASQHSDDFGTAGVTVLAKKTSNGDDLLAQLQQQLTQQREETETSENGGGGASDGDEPLLLDDETSAQLSQIFGAAALANASDGAAGNDFGAGASDGSASHNDVLQNLSAIFSAAATANANSADGLTLGEAGDSESGEMSPIRFNHNNNPIRRRAPRGCGSNQSISKKRVLGECAACHKPITAGARQMHMFYHLGKDQGTYRFRCKHENCDVEHYRKDQMENHHSKVHGKIEADMMEDRSLELYDQCQKMSMDLLGTVGNTPGPTAAKAQILYDNMQREAEMAAFRKRKRNRHSSSGNFHNNSQSNNNVSYLTNEENNNKNNNNMSAVDVDFIRRIQQQLKNRTANGYGNRSFGSNNNHNHNHGNTAVRIPVATPSGETSRHEECIECQRCHQTIVGRTRGFHILRHLHNDLGIVRYACQRCDFRHDRAQSVQTHGKKEHRDEDCVVDLIDDYQDDVRAMSKACFGREQLFAKEERRRSRIAAASPQSQIQPTTTTVSTTSMAEEPAKPPAVPRIIIKTSPTIPTAQVVPSSSSSASATARRKVSQRRFGIRRPKSRKQREEMAKLREVSMRLGGAQYFKKRSSESVACEICGKYNTTRLSQHAYNHLEDCSLYLCPQCNMGHCSRDIIVKHLKDFHDSVESPTDNRLRYAAEIKEMVRKCFPSCFVDAPIPTAADIERLKINLNLSDKALATIDADTEGHEAGEDGQHDDDDVDGEEEEEEDAEDSQEVHEGHEDHEDSPDEDVTNVKCEISQSAHDVDSGGTVSGDEDENENENENEEDEDEEAEDSQLQIAEEDEQDDADACGENELDEPDEQEGHDEEQEEYEDQQELDEDETMNESDEDSLKISAGASRLESGPTGLETEDDY